MKVLFSKPVLDYFTDLVQILYDKEYFGFEDSAIEYVNELIDIIERTLPLKAKYKAPLYFER